MNDFICEYALLVETKGGSLVPISYGESDVECAFWLSEHAEHYKNDTVYVAHLTLLQEAPEDTN